MDESKLLQLANTISSEGVSVNEACSIIEAYCIERGKKQEDVDKFITALIKTPVPLIISLLQPVFEYYTYKYHWFLLCSKGNSKRILYYK